MKNKDIKAEALPSEDIGKTEEKEIYPETEENTDSDITEAGEKEEITAEELKKIILKIINSEKEIQKYEKQKKEAKNKDENLNDIREKLKREEKERDSDKEILFYLLRTKDIKVLKAFTDAMTELYGNEKELRKNLKDLLVSEKIRNTYKAKRENSKDMFEILSSVDKVFPVRDYPMFTLDTNAPLYGSEIIRASSRTLLPPLSVNDIIETVGMLIDYGDSKDAIKWIYDVLDFKPDLLNNINNDAKEDRKTLVNDMMVFIKTNNKAKAVLMENLIEHEEFFRLLKAEQSLTEEKKKNETSEREKRKSEEEKERIIQEKNKQIENLNVLSEKKDSDILILNNKLINYDKLSESLTEAIRSRENQILINETLEEDKERKLSAAQKYVDEAKEKTEKVLSEYEELNRKYESVCSDLTLKTGELSKAEDEMKNISEISKITLLQDLVKNLNEKLFYIKSFYLDLLENGSLTSDSIGIFGDTLNEIDSAFALEGAERYGEIDEITEYDSSLYEPVEVRISNGEKAKITGFGWKINGKVFIKANVEKVEE